jgi:hypothetical protein
LNAIPSQMSQAALAANTPEVCSDDHGGDTQGVDSHSSIQVAVADEHRYTMAVKKRP